LLSDKLRFLLRNSWFCGSGESQRASKRDVSYTFDGYVLDARRRELRRAGHLVPLEPQSFDLLRFLICNRDRVVSRDELLAGIWKGRIVSESTLSSRINAVRSAIGDNGRDQRLIKTLSKQGIRFIGAVTEDTASADANPARTLPHTASIAVLPFTNLGADRRQDYFSDGVVEDIITELSRFSELFVIARNSSFQYKNKDLDVRQVGEELGVRYILEGSVRRAAGRVRISAQLIDASNGTHRWAERYDRKLIDPLSVQDDVARTVAAVLVAHVNHAEAARALLKPARTWQAYDYYLRAVEMLNTFWTSPNKADLYKTRELLNRALEVEPTYARAHALLADTIISVWHLPLDDDYLNDEAIERAYRSSCAAVQHDPALPFAHAIVGLVLGYKRQHEASLQALERATALNANYTDWRFVQALLMAGEHRRAVEAGHAYIRTDPFYPPRAAVWLGVAHFMMRRYREARPYLQEATLRAPNSRGAHLWSAANYAQWGRREEARNEIAAAMKIDPKFTVASQARQAAVCKHQRDIDHLLDGLRKAGLPEN
jgi:adenylate cyclase